MMAGGRSSGSTSRRRTERGVSPVVGIALLIAITLLLAAIFSVSFGHLGDLGEEEERVDRLIGEPDRSTYPDQTLVPVKAPGDEPRTTGGDILEFRFEHAGDDDLTVVAIEIETTLDADLAVDDGNAAEVELRRVDQTGTANRDGDPSQFDADGTRYGLVEDSNNGGQEAVIGEGTDDAELDIRRFTTDLGPLEFADAEDDADVTVTLVLDDGSEQAFYFTPQ